MRTTNLEGWATYLSWLGEGRPENFARAQPCPSFYLAALILSHWKTSKWLTVFEIALVCITKPWPLTTLCAFVLFFYVYMQEAFIPVLHTSIWRPDICIWRLFFNNYLLVPFLKKMAPKTSLQGPPALK